VGLTRKLDKSPNESQTGNGSFGIVNWLGDEPFLHRRNSNDFKAHLAQTASDFHDRRWLLHRGEFLV
jgi:hypothetical protein